MAAALDQSPSQPPVESLAGGPATDAAPTSITPPHSANGKTDAPDGVPSELSDLELDSKANAPPATVSLEEEEIEPDHYYGGGKIPVFKPVSGLFCGCRLDDTKHTSILCSPDGIDH